MVREMSGLARRAPERLARGKLPLNGPGMPQMSTERAKSGSRRGYTVVEFPGSVAQSDITASSDPSESSPCATSPVKTSRPIHPLMLCKVKAGETKRSLTSAVPRLGVGDYQPPLCEALRPGRIIVTITTSGWSYLPKKVHLRSGFQVVMFREGPDGGLPTIKR